MLSTTDTLVAKIIISDIIPTFTYIRICDSESRESPTCLLIIMHYKFN